MMISYVGSTRYFPDNVATMQVLLLSDKVYGPCNSWSDYIIGDTCKMRIVKGKDKEELVSYVSSYPLHPPTYDSVSLH